MLSQFYDEQTAAEYDQFPTVDYRTPDRLQYFAWPGGYPIAYLDSDNCLLCPECATELRREYALELLGAFCQWVDSGEDYAQHETTTLLYTRDLPRAGLVLESDDDNDNCQCERCNREIA